MRSNLQHGFLLRELTISVVFRRLATKRLLQHNLLPSKSVGARCKHWICLGGPGYGITNL